MIGNAVGQPRHRPAISYTCGCMSAQDRTKKQKQLLIIDYCKLSQTKFSARTADIAAGHMWNMTEYRTPIYIGDNGLREERQKTLSFKNSPVPRRWPLCNACAIRRPQGYWPHTRLTLLIIASHGQQEGSTGTRSKPTSCYVSFAANTYRLT